MNSTSKTQTQRANASEGAAKGEYFNLHASGCGYLSRVRWVTPEGKGRKAEPFLACAINALRGDVQDAGYTYFDLRVSGDEAQQLVEQLREDVDKDRKVFVAFKVGDFYSHEYQRAKRDADGRKTGEMEWKSLIKGRLLLITHVKVNGETVYQRESDDGGEESGVREDTELDDGGDNTPVEPPKAAERGAAPASRPQRGTRSQTDRTQVRSYGERQAVPA